MTVVEVKDIVDQKKELPKMKHILDTSRLPGIWSLCGRKTSKIHSGTQEIDCVVCEDLWEGKRQWD
jgi:hypothetical protein